MAYSRVTAVVIGFGIGVDGYFFRHSLCDACDLRCCTLVPYLGGGFSGFSLAIIYLYHLSLSSLDSSCC